MLRQVRREAWAGILALEAAAALEVDLSEPDAVVILRNDAVGALAVLRKGSFSSTFPQQCAMRSCRLQRRAGCQTHCPHAPGRVHMDEGVDDHPRPAPAPWKWQAQSAANSSGPTPDSSLLPVDGL